MRAVYLFIFLFLISPSLIGATFTWDGSVNSDWNNALNWTADSGLPGSSDDVVITSNGTSPITNVAVNVASLTIMSGTLTVNEGFGITCTGFTLTAGTIDLGEGLDVNGNFVANAGSIDLSNDITEDIRVSGSITIAGGVTVTTNGFGAWAPDGGTTQNLTTNGVNMVSLWLQGANTKVVCQDALNLSVGLVLDASTTLDLNGQNLDMTGSSVNTVAGTIEFHGTETLTLPSSIGAGTWKCAGGSASTTLANYSSITFVNLNFDETTASTTFTMTGNLVTSGNFTITDGTLDVSASNYMITVGGNLDLSNADADFVERSGTVVLNKSAGTQTINTGGTESLYNLTHSAAGTAQITGGALTVTNNFSNSSGAFDLNGNNLTVSGSTFTNSNTIEFHGTETLTLPSNTGAGTWKCAGGSASTTLANYSSITFVNLTFDETTASTTFTMTGNLVTSGNFTITDGTLDVSASNYMITVGGNLDFSNADADFVERSGTVVLNKSAGTQTINTGGTESLYNLTHSAAGTAQITGGALTVTNNFSNSSGTFDLSTQTLNVGGNFTNSASITKGSSTVVFNGSGNQSFNPGTSTYNNITYSVAGQTLTLANHLTATGALNLGNATATLDLNGFNLNLTSGSFTHTGILALEGDEVLTNVTTGVSAGTGTVKYTGGIATAINVADTTGITDYFNLEFDGTNRTFVVLQNITVTGSFTVTNGTVNTSNNSISITLDGSANQTFTTGGGSYYSVIHTPGAAATLMFSGAVTVTNTLTSSNANSTIDFNGQSVTLTGATLSTTGTLEFDGDETINGTISNDTDSGTVKFAGNGTGTAFTLPTTIATYFNLTFDDAGTTFTLSQAIDINGTLTITNGTLDVSANNYQINVGGNWSNSGTFTARAGTVVLDASGGTTQTVLGTTTFYNLKKTDATADGTAENLRFDDAMTQTITGNLTLKGAISGVGVVDYLVVDDDAAGSFTLALSGSTDIIYINLSSSTATGNSGYATHSNDMTGNTNWVFNLGSASATLSEITLGASGKVTVSLTTGTNIPVDGKVKITFPSAFTVSSSFNNTHITNLSGNNGATVKVAGTGASGNVLTIVFETAVITPDTLSFDIAAGIVTNPSSSGSYSGFSVQTTTSADSQIEISSGSLLNFVVTNQATLEFLGTSGYETDGANPDSLVNSGTVVFSCKYTDADGNAPSLSQIEIDLNGDNQYDYFERFNMVASGTDYANGVTFTYTAAPLYHNASLSTTSGNIDYQFTFRDGDGGAVSGSAATASRHIQTSTDGDLSAVAASGGSFTNGFFNPTGNSGGSLGEACQFRAHYSDTNGPFGEAPLIANVVIDNNDDDQFTPDERFSLSQLNPSVTNYASETATATAGVDFNYIHTFMQAASTALTIKYFFEFVSPTSGYLRTSTQTLTIGPTGGTDTDSDGVSDEAEGLTADTDGDGTNDYLDPDSGTFQLPDGDTVKYAMSSGSDVIQVSNFQCVPAGTDDENVVKQEGLPTNLTFEDGFVSFTVTGLDSGDELTVVLTPSTLAGTSKAFYKYNTGTKTWSTIPFTETATTITYTVTDGGTGDSDGVANGVIVDPGGLGGIFGGGGSSGGSLFSGAAGGAATAAAALGLGGSSGGACLIDRPAQANSLYWAFAVLTLISAAFYLRRA